jgi:hypothetical protein
MTMVKPITILCILLLFCSDIVWAQKSVILDDRAARKQWEAEQRADEYANSLRRRDWLKDRLILEMGMGTKFPAMGANWFGFGAGVEYITRWHASGFLTGGFILPHDDQAFPDYYTLDGGLGWRLGFGYYLFPKNPIHISFQASYGTVFYDHVSKPDTSTNVRPILICYGYELDAVVSYLSDEWYFLQAIIGVYTIGNGIKASKTGKSTTDPYDTDPYKGSYDSFGRSNPSWARMNDGSYFSLVENNNGKGGIPPVGVVFGVGIGFAFEEFFPDDTELRRRERESNKARQNQFRREHSSSFRN